MAFKMKGAPYPSNRKGAVNKEPQGNVNGRAKSSANRLNIQISTKYCL